MLDIAIVSDHVALEVPYNGKVEKYNMEKVRKYAREVSQKEMVSIGGFIINWRGAISKRSVKFCKDFISTRELPILSLRTMQYGVYIYDM